MDWMTIALIVLIVWVLAITVCVNLLDTAVDESREKALCTRYEVNALERDIQKLKAGAKELSTINENQALILEHFGLSIKDGKRIVKKDSKIEK